MTEDATLTDFGEGDTADAASSEDETVDDGAEAGEAIDAGEASDPDAVAPVRSTYAWGDYACADCGASIDRAWRDGDAFVCASCKEW